MIGLKDIIEARERISDTISCTPLLQSSQLTARTGYPVYLKGEHLQKTGSFKIRGATNKVKEAFNQGTQHVITASSGNHGQAVAYIANQLNIRSTIVVPTNVSLCKSNAITAYNGIIEKFGTTSAERLPKAQEIAHQKRGMYIPPYDDYAIIAGQGTIGLEILDQLDDIGTIVVPIGGGGLISGILAAVKKMKPSIKIIGVEPMLANDTYISLQNKKITAIKGSTATIADGLRASQPGNLTFPIIAKYLDDLVLVSEDEIRYALSFVLERMKQMIEPSSATVIAATLFQKFTVNKGNLVCIISGGNLDVEHISDFIISTQST
ncbi:threonine/serine dehydratase [Bacillus cereus]|uniref:threonine/serine dehydratase n=2 Tax=Bacillus cereus TaxID=1396 RepID=UPI000B4AA3EE|nr:threonine/serine dehydratase [Bacillus cereus]MEC3196178.1 threonine/serine dehydratase [Bacillus cereus]PES12323.1 threonine/serine dehydratase [Bacillus cereus]PEX16922.1 threonine/serine dehydratase [Bacillus cereus]PFC35639.1 threonine/serine dehydratase [Bacillus cereus]PFQ72105.1 threonine/serine dehydratase [Bacillus cereus]